jgi:hypothetical protein
VKRDRLLCDTLWTSATSPSAILTGT